VYSDKPQLIGAVYHLSRSTVEALRSGRSEAEISDLSEPENKFERGHGKLLEVYQPVRAASGQKLLFETYFSYRTVTQREHQIWAEFAPITFGTLILLQLVQIPLARRMARRLDASQRERERLMRDALAASDATRRRIARDVHDGVVQDLIAVSYTLNGSAARAGSGAAAQALHSAAETVRHGIGALRSLLVEIYPPSLHAAGLPAALSDLASSVSDRGVDITLAVPDEVSASPQAEEVVFRTAQEVLRNVVTHANAQHADLALQQRDRQLVLTISDDGVGFDVGTVNDPGTQGHLGLRLLHDLAAEADASLEIHTAPGHGTRVQLEVPVT
jgi:signal transduction histidine kinase